MEQLKQTPEQRKNFYEWYGKELIRKMELIASADILNKEAVELWMMVKECDWVKPEIKEKWERAFNNIKK